jgi:uncharacterized repeat protein (TIGR01451 family)
MKHLAIVVGCLALGSVARAQESDLLVEQTAPASADADTDVTFMVTLSNLGPDDAANATLSDPLPPGMTFVSVDASASGPCSTPAVGANGTITCTLATLAASQQATFTIVGHIDAATAPGTYFSNIVSASSDSSDPTDENSASTGTVQTPPLPAADLQVTVQNANATNPDHDVTYTIQVTNGGPGDATHAAWQVTLPGTMTFVSLLQDTGPTFGCTSGASISCTLDPFTAGASATFTLIGHVPLATADGTSYQFTASVTSDNDPNDENDGAPSYVCVQTDSCSAGSCNGNVAVVCGAGDQCNDAMTCDSVTGACVAHPKADDTPCDDSDACTQTDTCQSGVCSGGDPVVCPSASMCQTQGTCDPASGQCSANAPVTDGTACDDGDACTQTDTCTSGACNGADPVVCVLAGQCQVQGTCDPSTGVCDANAPKSDGTACDDGEACSEDDRCSGGLCAGTDADCDADAGSSDAGTPDAAVEDAGRVDGSGGRSGGTQHDAGSSAGGAGSGGRGGAGHAGGGSDADANAGLATDAGADAGAQGSDGGDCGCRIAGGHRTHAAGRAFCMLLALGAAIRVRRRR